MTTVITSLWRLDAEVDVPRATQKLLGTRPDHSIRVEILRTLLNRNLEHDALKFMRVAEFPPSNEDEKELAIRVYLKCGLWQEALYRQREYVRSSSKKDEVRSTLVPLILEHVYVNRAAPQQNRGQVQDDEDKMDEDDEVVRGVVFERDHVTSLHLSIFNLTYLTSNTTTGTTLQCLGSTFERKGGRDLDLVS